MCLGFASKIEKFRSIADHCSGVWLVWRGQGLGGKNIAPKNSENLLSQNSPIADVVSNHSIFDDGWVVQQLVPRQAEKS